MYAISASGQGLDYYDFKVNAQDTVINIPYGGKEANSGINLDNGFTYFLTFYEDFATYVLYVSAPSPSSIYDALLRHASPIVFLTLSWGDYSIRGNKMLFNDRVAGFKMEASIEGNEIKFRRDYFPDIDKHVWDILRSNESTSSLFAIFDCKKAERYRNDYDKKFRKPFEFTPGVYNHSLEISENGEWKKKHRDLVLAEGKWHRKRNILILNCPKLKCDFYMVIGEEKLTSMLLLGDVFGTDYE